MKTYIQKPAEVKRAWILVDAKGRVLGQIATEVATKLIGKHKTTYTPHVDGGDYVVVINAAEIEITGRKGERKMYRDHSLFPGGLRERSFNTLKAENPTEIIQRAVFNMLPKNRLRKDRMDRLKVYATAEHPHETHVQGKK